MYCSPSLETDSSSITQEIPCLLKHSKVFYGFIEARPFSISGTRLAQVTGRVAQSV